MSLTLSSEEVEDITGGLTQPRRQVAELHKRGFWRARLKNGRAILERPHYEAVCAGALPPGKSKGDTRGRPQLLPI
jgi:hypothetical protein